MSCNGGKEELVIRFVIRSLLKNQCISAVISGDVGTDAWHCTFKPALIAQGLQLVSGGGSRK